MSSWAPSLTRSVAMTVRTMFKGTKESWKDGLMSVGLQAGPGGRTCRLFLNRSTIRSTTSQATRQLAQVMRPPPRTALILRRTQRSHPFSQSRVTGARPDVVHVCVSAVTLWSTTGDRESARARHPVPDEKSEPSGRISQMIPTGAVSRDDREVHARMYRS